MHLITCIVGRVCAIQLKYVLYFSTTVYYVVLHVRKFLHREDTQCANEVTSSIKLNILHQDFEEIINDTHAICCTQTH